MVLFGPVPIPGREGGKSICSIRVGKRRVADTITLTPKFNGVNVASAVFVPLVTAVQALMTGPSDMSRW